MGVMLMAGRWIEANGTDLVFLRLMVPTFPESARGRLRGASESSITERGGCETDHKAMKRKGGFFCLFLFFCFSCHCLFPHVMALLSLEDVDRGIAALSLFEASPADLSAAFNTLRRAISIGPITPENEAINKRNRLHILDHPEVLEACKRALNNESVRKERQTMVKTSNVLN